MAVAHDVADVLRKRGLRVKVDDRDLHPGQKYYDWEIKGVPLRLDIGPRDIAQGTAFAARRTGGKEPLSMDTIVDECYRVLDEISEELRSRASQHMDDVVQPLPTFKQEKGSWTMEGDVKDGHIYELAFDGSDADAELIEQITGMSFLGDATELYVNERPCHVSGNMTTRRVLLAKSY